MYRITLLLVAAIAALAVSGVCSHRVANWRKCDGDLGRARAPANPLRKSADFCIWAEWRTPTSGSDKCTAIADDWPYVRDAMS